MSLTNTGWWTWCGRKPDGYVYGPEKSGLGLEVDWETMEAATIHRLSFP